LTNRGQKIQGTGISLHYMFIYPVEKQSHKTNFALFHRIEFLLLSLSSNDNSFDTMKLFLLFVLSVFIITTHAAKNVCLHNESNGKHCTSLAQRSGQQVIRPSVSQNKKCYNLCIESGYKNGGRCSVSKKCFRFCSYRS
jgi:hypothetical protein